MIGRYGRYGRYDAVLPLDPDARDGERLRVFRDRLDDGTDISTERVLPERVMSLNAQRLEIQERIPLTPEHVLWLSNRLIEIVAEYRAAGLLPPEVTP